MIQHGVHLNRQNKEHYVSTAASKTAHESDGPVIELDICILFLFTWLIRIGWRVRALKMGRVFVVTYVRRVAVRDAAVVTGFR